MGNRPLIAPPSFVDGGPPRTPESPVVDRSEQTTAYVHGGECSAGSPALELGEV